MEKMADLMTSVDAMQDLRRTVFGEEKTLTPLDQLVLVGAVASNNKKELEEICFENSSSALEALRKLEALKIICPRRDEDTDLRTDFKKPKKRGSFDTKKEMNYSRRHLGSTTWHQDSLPEEFKRKIETMGGCCENAQLVFEKKLFRSDLDRGQARFSMPIYQLKCNFLEKKEVEWLEISGHELNITVIDPVVEEEDGMCLTKWNKSYVLRTRWNHVAAKIHLKRDDLIQVWSFRNKTNNRLYLALVKRGDEDSDGAGCISSSSNTSIITM